MVHRSRIHSFMTIFLFLMLRIILFIYHETKTIKGIIYQKETVFCSLRSKRSQALPHPDDAVVGRRKTSTVARVGLFEGPDCDHTHYVVRTNPTIHKVSYNLTNTGVLL